MVDLWIATSYKECTLKFYEDKIMTIMKLSFVCIAAGAILALGMRLLDERTRNIRLQEEIERLIAERDRLRGKKAA